MEAYNKQFAAFRLNVEKGSATKEIQIDAIKAHFKKRYGVEATDILIGPIVINGQTFVPDNHIYIPIPDQDIEKPMFTTGYVK